jgi:type III pantothenate kinase
MKINLVLDIGNTHICGGLYQENQLINTWRWSSDKAKTEDEYFCLLSMLLQTLQIPHKEIQHFALCSVVPSLTRTFQHVAEKYFGKSAIVINAYSNLGLTFPMKDPGFIGADLIVNAFAAKEKYKTNCIICDLGTATTIQFVDKDGYFHGTIIAPGILTSASNLFEKASQLANIQLQLSDNVLGINTADAISSGIIRGNAFMIDGFIQQIKEEFRQYFPIKAIATGGMAAMIHQTAKEIDTVDKTLTLDGLNIACMRN